MPKQTSKKANVIFYHIDNFGQGELGCYAGGKVRGAVTKRIDQFAAEGFKLTHYVVEAQCTPTRSALMTGRYALRSGTHTVALAGESGGLVAWERTMGDLLSDAGYATCCMGKWHIGAEDGRWPTDHGFDEWYGPAHSYDECLWPDDPFYDPKRDPVSYMFEGTRDDGVRELKDQQITLELRRNVDVEYNKRAFDFIKRSASADKPFFLYFNHSMMHLPNIPRDEFKGKSGKGDWADCLLELDSDFGALLDLVDELGISDNTIIVFAGDNGPEEMQLWRGSSGYFNGSYFTSSEGGIRTPCLIRWPGKVAAGRDSNEMVHVTDMFTTLLSMAACQVPDDRIIDGVDQSGLFLGKKEESGRDGCVVFVGDQLHGAKWKDFKLLFKKQMYFFDAVPPLGFIHLINLITDPKEREPINHQHLHTWVMAHMGRILKGFKDSLKEEPPIPAGAPLDFVPKAGKKK